MRILKRAEIENLRVHDPAADRSLGFVIGRVHAKSDAAFKELLENFLRVYRERLHDENWGEQARVRGDNTLAAMSWIPSSNDRHSVTRIGKELWTATRRATFV